MSVCRLTCVKWLLFLVLFFSDSHKTWHTFYVAYAQKTMDQICEILIQNFLANILNFK